MILGSLKRSIKSSLLVIALALLACIAGLVWFGSRPDEPIAESVLDQSQGPAFEVRVVAPRSGLPLAGFLPDWLVRKHNLTPHVLRFDHMSRGAKIGVVRQHWIELFADGWDFFIELDVEGRVAPGTTHLEFPVGLGGRQVKLDCRPGDPATGYLRTTARPGSERLDGRFLVELVTCKNAESGKTTNWPPAPLTVSGSFADLPPGRR